LLSLHSSAAAAADDDDESVCGTAGMMLNEEAEVLREKPLSALFTHHGSHTDWPGIESVPAK
jgi:hypothetical protein